MAANTARVRVGRLLEIRTDAGHRSAADVDALFDEIHRELSRLPATQKHVTVVDWRHCPLMSPEAAARITHHISMVNARTERSAALARDDAPTAVLQFVRVIREAGLPDRKLFFDEQDLAAWLGEVLTPAERERLRAFLRDGRHLAAP
jgi:hypothetical protein